MVKPNEVIDEKRWLCRMDVPALLKPKAVNVYVHVDVHVDVDGIQLFSPDVNHALPIRRFGENLQSIFLHQHAYI